MSLSRVLTLIATKKKRAPEINHDYQYIKPVNYGHTYNNMAILVSFKIIALSTSKSDAASPQVINRSITFMGKTYTDGDTLNVIIERGALLPESFPAFFGGETTINGESNILLDLGYQKLTVPLKDILLLSHSTAYIEPTPEKLSFKLYRAWDVFVARSNLHLGEEFLPLLEILTGLTGAASILNMIFKPYADAFESIFISATVICIIAFSIFIRKKYANETMPLMGSSFLKALDSYLRDTNKAFRFAEVLNENDSRDRLYFLKNIFSKQSNIPKQAIIEAFETSQIVKKHLESLGVSTKLPISIWATNRFIRSFKGPRYYLRSDHIVIAPYKFSKNNIKPTKKNKTPVDNTLFNNNIHSGAIYGHEMTHLLLIRNSGSVPTIIEEALADYFSASATNSDPKLMNWSESLPGREGVKRNLMGSQYPHHLNMNSLAQVNDDDHMSSQLIFRILWTIRDRFGRDQLDPLVIKANHIINYVDHLLADHLYNMESPWLSEPKEKNSRIFNSMSAYTFLIALLHASHNNKDLYEYIFQVAQDYDIPRSKLEEGLDLQTTFELKKQPTPPPQHPFPRARVR